MTTRRALTCIAIVAGIAALAGCPLCPAMLVGSLGLDSSGPGTVWGGTEYHVLLFAEGAAVNLDDLSNPAPVESMTGTLPGGPGAAYTSINYVLAHVPAGEYFLLAWVDSNGIPGFNRWADYFGFYDWDPGAFPSFNSMQPMYPNVNIPLSGVVDVDLVLGVLGT